MLFVENRKIHDADSQIMEFPEKFLSSYRQNIVVS